MNTVRQLDLFPEFVVVEDLDPWSEAIELSHEITIFIPSTVDVDNQDALLARSVLNTVANQLAKLYGGSTVNSPCVGRWIAESGSEVLEDVTPVTVYVSELSREVKLQVKSLVDYVKTTMSQEAVLLVVDGSGKLF